MTSTPTLRYAASDSTLREERYEKGATDASWTSALEPSLSLQVPGKQRNASTPTRDAGTDGDEDEEPKGYATGLNLLAINLCMNLACVCVALDASILGTAIPQITTDFNSSSEIGWYGSAYTLTTCCFQLMFGNLYSILDVRCVFLTALGIFELGSLICAVAPSSIVLILGRAIAGIGCSGLMSGSLVIISLSFHISERPKYAGILGAFASIAQVIAPFLGGVFTSKLSWRWCFWINLPCGFIAALALVFLVRLPRQSISDRPASLRQAFRNFDWLGTACLFPALICLLLVLQWGGVLYAWSNWWIILMLCLFGSATICWGFVQYQLGDRATVPGRILKNRSMAGALWVSFCLTGCIYVGSQYIPIWFQVVQDATPYQSGINFLPATGTIVVASLLSGFLTSIFGYYNPLMFAAGIVSAAAGGMIYRFGVETPTAYWVCAQLLYGFGAGMSVQPPLMVPQNILKRSDLAAGIVVIVLSQSLSGTIFQSVGNNLLNGRAVAIIEATLPEVDPGVVMHAGFGHLASSMREIYPDFVVEIIEAYAEALRQVFLILIILASISLLGAAVVEWKSVKRFNGSRPGAKTELTSV